MQALHDLVQQGLVHYIGMSSCWAWQMQLMQRESSPELPVLQANRSRIRHQQPLDPVHLDAKPA